MAQATYSQTEQTLLMLIRQMKSADRILARASADQFYRELYKRLKVSPMVYCYPSLSPQIIEELIQEAIIGVYNGLPGFKGNSGVATWAQTIFENKIRDHFRASGAMMVPMDDEQLEEAIEAAQFCERDDVYETVASREGLDIADKCLNRMGDRTLPSAVLKQWSLGDSIHELARTHGIPVRTLHDKFQLAYKKLLDCMRQHGWTTSRG